jgi:hypothetical protein
MSRLRPTARTGPARQCPVCLIVLHSQLAAVKKYHPTPLHSLS